MERWGKKRVVKDEQGMKGAKDKRLLVWHQGVGAKVIHWWSFPMGYCCDLFPGFWTTPFILFASPASKAPTGCLSHPALSQLPVRGPCNVIYFLPSFPPSSVHNYWGYHLYWTTIGFIAQRASRSIYLRLLRPSSRNGSSSERKNVNGNGRGFVCG